MTLWRVAHSHSRLARLSSTVILAGIAAIVPRLHAADDFDSYKIKISGSWFYSKPSGTFQSANGSGTVDIVKDLGFNSYSTFSGKLDWKFTRKNHLFLVVSPFDLSRQTALTRTIVFQGQTFVAGLTTHSELRSNLYALGYEYDIVRRERGHLGIAAQFDLFDTRASITATGQITGSGVQQATRTASGSLLAPIPVFGPEFRVYLARQVYVQGNVYGMYFFGYGDFISSSGSLGFRLATHFGVNVGYQLGSRFVVNNNNSSNRIGLRFTQKGPVGGVEFPF